MKTFSSLLGVLLLTASGAQAVEYTFDSSAQGWFAETAATGAPPLTVVDGKIRLDYATATEVFDPRLVSPPTYFRARSARWLVLEVAMTAAPGSGPQPFQLFFENEAGGFSEGRSRVAHVQPNAGMQRVVLDLSAVQPGRDPWEGLITRVRIDPGNAASELIGYTCEIDSIAFTMDTDNDGLSDEYELATYGDLDTVDESEVPLGITGIAVVTMGAIGAATLLRRRQR
jgi:hypothetical protein